MAMCSFISRNLLPLPPLRFVAPFFPSNRQLGFYDFDPVDCEVFGDSCIGGFNFSSFSFLHTVERRAAQCTFAPHHGYMRTWEANSSNRAPLVDNAQIQSASFHTPLPLWLRLYVWPFAILWPIFLSVYLSEDRYDEYIDGPEWTFVWVGTIFTLQSLAWLTTKWNVSLDAAFTARRVKTVDEAELIKVVPVANAGAPAICKI